MKQLKKLKFVFRYRKDSSYCIQETATKNAVGSNLGQELCGERLKTKSKISKIPEVRKLAPESHPDLRFDMEEPEIIEENFENSPEKMTGGAIFAIVFAVFGTLMATGYFIFTRRNRSRQFDHVVMTNLE